MKLIELLKVSPRFWLKVSKQSNGCWLWTSGQNEVGYGHFRFQGKSRYAHRIAWLLTHGTWPAASLHHTCENKLCVNPKHLHELSRAEHTRLHSVEREPKTHCVNGHEFTEANTYWTPTGKRNCRVCKRAAKLRFQQRAA